MTLTLKSIYNACFHSIIKYGIIFGSDCFNSGKIFTLQKKVIRIMAVAQPSTTCSSLLNNLILYLYHVCQYILLLLNFIINNQKIFQTHSSIHSINIWNKHHLHKSNANLYCFQKSKFYAGIKVLNILPPSVTVLKNDEAKFKAVLKKYLRTHSFYFVDECLYV